MATMTIRIAKADTKVRVLDEKTKQYKIQESRAGHMWFEVKSKKINFSSGFVPVAEGNPLGKGKTVSTDSTSYAEAYYTATIDISEADVVKLRALHNKPASFGFSNYNFVKNSCVDYVYKALFLIGKNPNYINGNDGDSFPASNVDNIAELLGSLIKEKNPLGTMHYEFGNVKPIFYGAFHTVLNSKIQNTPLSASRNMAQASVRSTNATEMLMLEQPSLASEPEMASFNTQLNRMIEAMASFGNENGVAVDNLANQVHHQNVPQLVASAI